MKTTFALCKNFSLVLTYIGKKAANKKSSSEYEAGESYKLATHSFCFQYMTLTKEFAAFTGDGNLFG
jgi:fructoselysine-6-P-deglycase FrlB-like protein